MICISPVGNLITVTTGFNWLVIVMTNLTKSLDPRPLFSRFSRLATAPRRSHLGSSRPAEELGQPQDGALSSEDILDAGASSLVKAPGRREPEDALLTGGTRSLMRRVLGLNVTQLAGKSIRPLSARLPKLTLRQQPSA